MPRWRRRRWASETSTGSSRSCSGWNWTGRHWAGCKRPDQRKWFFRRGGGVPLGGGWAGCRPPCAVSCFCSGPTAEHGLRTVIFLLRARSGRILGERDTGLAGLGFGLLCTGSRPHRSPSLGLGGAFPNKTRFFLAWIIKATVSHGHCLLPQVCLELLACAYSNRLQITCT